MPRKVFLIFGVLVVLLASTSIVLAQGVQTATLKGVVTDSSGAPLPGVTVTLKSPALMSDRTTVTRSGGDYLMPGLPPGAYTITFELAGMQTTRTHKNLDLGLQSVVNAKLKVAAVAEAITVTAAEPTVLENQTVGANIKKQEVDALPLLRTPVDIGELSPGVTGDSGGRNTTPVGGQLSINGGLAYDNNFLIDGVNVQDNIFGQTNNLFIEDAIQETQVLTSGISAEYGHFTGGVLNVITKSGGNTFSGSFRDDLTKPSWTALTPYEQGFRGPGLKPGAVSPHIGPLSNVYEATLGGPIWRDRLWFFLAGRDQQQTSTLSLPVTGVNVAQTTTNKRPEIKLTGNLGSSQTLQGDYVSNPVSQNYNSQVTPLTISALGTNTKEPNSGESLFYSGVFSSSLYAEARASKKHFEFVGLGGHLTDIPDSPFRSFTRVNGVTCNGCTFNAPYFDSTDPENRNNKQLFAALSYFVSKPRIGTHEIKGGFEQFIDERTGGNSQSATSYVFFGGYAVDSSGNPILDSNGNLVPVFNPRSGGVSQETRIANFIATRGAKIDITTNSLFINDRWTLNNHFNFNLGARYEKTHSFATGGIVGINTSNIVPRLGATYDPLANGKYKVDVTYAEYVGRYNPGIVNQNSPVGSPNLLYGYYVGPQGQGKSFAPGWDPSNYKFYTARVNSATVLFAPGLHAPISKEWTISGGTQLPKNGWLKATLASRKYTDFINSFRSISIGCTNVVLNGINAGCVDNLLYKNTNIPKRSYLGLDLQAHYDITHVWAVEGNWTHQFKNDGNYEGEGGQALGQSAVGNYPEMQDPRELPVGHLAQYEANRMRVWSTYGLNFGRYGGLSAGLLWRYDSPLTYSYTATVARSAQSKALNPGYHNAPNAVTLFFGNRGIGSYNATSLFDLSLQYSVPVWKVVPWVKFDVRNIFNSTTLLTYNTAVNPDPNSPKDALGYPTGYIKTAAFGNPTGATSYVIPRTYLLYAGIRF